jgi:hypothetical protein
MFMVLNSPPMPGHPQALPLLQLGIAVRGLFPASLRS